MQIPRNFPGPRPETLGAPPGVLSNRCIMWAHFYAGSDGVMLRAGERSPPEGPRGGPGRAPAGAPGRASGGPGNRGFPRGIVCSGRTQFIGHYTSGNMLRHVWMIVDHGEINDFVLYMYKSIGLYLYMITPEVPEGLSAHGMGP